MVNKACHRQAKSNCIRDQFETRCVLSFIRVADHEPRRTVDHQDKAHAPPENNHPMDFSAFAASELIRSGHSALRRLKRANSDGVGRFHLLAYSKQLSDEDT